MMVMTAKVDFKKILIILAVVVAVILGAILLLDRNENAEPTIAGTVSSNDGRVKFLEEMGWQVSASPTESSQVRIPEEDSEVFSRYNALQKSQGYDLSAYAGKTVMRYVYKVNNFPGATEPVYATVLISKNQVIGGDVTNTSAKGVIQGFKMPKQTQPTETQKTPETTTAPAT
jgi:hypothetical protein